jgi:hypothetical protein
VPYAVNTEWKLTLEDLGCPEFYVVFKDPQSLPVAEYRIMQKANVVLMRHQRDQTLPGDDELWAFNAIDDLLKRLLMQWNLPHPETNEPLPTKVDDPFELLPMPIYRYLADQVRERLMALPKSGRA